MVVELMQESPNANAARAVARVYQRLAEGLVAYLRAKWNIPTQSRWFGRVPRHRRWYFAGVTQLDLALATQTTIAPEAVPDDEWLERDLTAALFRSVARLAAAKNLRDLSTSLNLWAPLLRAIGAACQIDSGIDISKRLESAVAQGVAVGGSESVDLTSTMACVDLAALARIDLMLGFGNRMRGLDVNRLQEAIAAADWSKPATPELLGLPREARRAAEDLQRKVAFETKVEGERVTPPWYVAELVGFELSKMIVSSFNALIARSTETIPAASSATAVVAVADATRVSRRLEECAKLEALVSVVDERLRSLAQLNRSRDYNWTTWDTKSWSSTLDTARRLSHRAFARLILPLAAVATDERLPDLLGEAVTKTGEAVLLAIVREEHDHLEELFRPYFVGCLAVAERMRIERAIDDETRHAVLFTEAIVDLMSVSGYALLYAELTSTRASWSEIETAWKKWIGEKPERLVMLVSSIALRTGGLYGYTPRHWHRSSWDQLVREDLHRRAREGADLRRDDSALLRITYRSGFFADGAHIFSAGFLRAQPGAGDIDFGRDPFYESYKREQEQGTPAERDNDWPDDLDVGDEDADA
jgi:anti-sigma-K factor RskA